MLPPFDDNGYLPSGIHRAPVEEVEARFGTETELRRAQMDSIRWLLEACRNAGVERIILNGSFVTDVLEPNDVDCVLLVGSGFPRDPAAELVLRGGLPFVDISIVEKEPFTFFVEELFASDRSGLSKGMVEVIP